jgi:hypothetical protein
MSLTKPQIVLDPSGKNVPEAGFVIVQSEVEFLKKDGQGNLWITGYSCDFVRRVCEARNVDIVEVESPENGLRAIIGPLVDHLDPFIIKKSLAILEHQDPKSIAELLSALTGDEFWISEPSYSHAAKLLLLDISNDLNDLAEKQVELWAKTVLDPQLKGIYACNLRDRESVLRDWLLDSQVRKKLGEYPENLTRKHAELLRRELGQQLRLSKGLSISTFPKSTPNRNIYGKAIVEYFSQNATLLSPDLLSGISGLLSFNERDSLERLLPLSEIPPLSHLSDVQQALDWVTDKYLPQRLAQIENGTCFDADVMAMSFVDWLLENYPTLTHGEREESFLNIRTFYGVERLARDCWVLWVVVDGLNYLNHQKLLRLIGAKSMHLRPSENLPLIAILPTITERAKYGLTTGKFPDENTSLNWSTRNNFQSVFPNGTYAGNNGMSHLEEALRGETPTVCYWNYTKIDKCHHEQIDFNYLTHEIDAHLESLANHINKMVSTAHNPDKVAVVISTDHGQLTAPCKRLKPPSTDCQTLGRTLLHASDWPVDMTKAFVKDVAGETIELNPKSFRLGEPTTLALGSTFFVDMAATDSTDAIGAHGGLYPEEVVVGMAVLTSKPEYQPISAILTGEGEAGNNGTVRLAIDNPNHIAINPLSISVDALRLSQQGELLLAKVGPQTNFEIDLVVEVFPQPNAGNDFSIDGFLTYEFDDGRKEKCSVTGKLKCNSLYRPKNPSLLDRFKK